MITYFKSLELIDNKLQTRSYDSSMGGKITCQILVEILLTRTLKPNTKHSLLKDRLCVSALNTEYPETYRPEGIIFETDIYPSYAVPFDLMMLTTGKTFTSSDYNSQFLPGYEEFMFLNVEDMLKINQKKSSEALNKFRTKNGLEKIVVRRYNEVCFEDNIDIMPKALVGISEESRKLASQYNLPHFACVGEYLMSKRD